MNRNLSPEEFHGVFAEAEESRLYWGDQKTRSGFLRDVAHPGTRGSNLPESYVDHYDDDYSSFAPEALDDPGRALSTYINPPGGVYHPSRRN